MSYTRDDFHRDVFKELFCALKPEDVLEFLSPDQVRTLAERAAEQFEQWRIMRVLVDSARPTFRRVTNSNAVRQSRAKSKTSVARTPRTAPPSRSREP